MKVRKLSRDEIRERLYSRRFLIPHAVTLANMFCGFLTIIYSSSGRIEKASIAIGFALLLDGLDGRVARRLNATSKFGVEFDSFSDLVSFGVAPAILMYHWCFRTLADEWGVFISFVYVICAASRLARFNISAENLKNFVGLPTPGAAALVASLAYFMPELTQSFIYVGIGTVLMLALSYLMVSKVEFFSVKLLKVSHIGWFAPIVVGAMIAFVWKYTQLGFISLAGLYVLSGPLKLLFRRKSGASALEAQDKIAS